MTIDFTCQKCEASFELDSQDLLDGTEKLVCPHCDAKAPINLVDDFNAALTEMVSAVAALSKKFSVNLAIETEDLDADLTEKDEEEAEEDEEDEESDDDELDFDEDDADAEEEEDAG